MQLSFCIFARPFYNSKKRGHIFFKEKKLTFLLVKKSGSFFGLYFVTSVVCVVFSEGDFLIQGDFCEGRGHCKWEPGGSSFNYIYINNELSALLLVSNANSTLI